MASKYILDVVGTKAFGIIFSQITHNWLRMHELQKSYNHTQLAHTITQQTRLATWSLHTATLEWWSPGECVV